MCVIRKPNDMQYRKKRLTLVVLLSLPLPRCLHTSLSGFLRTYSDWTWIDLTHSISQTFPLNDSQMCELWPKKSKEEKSRVLCRLSESERGDTAQACHVRVPPLPQRTAPAHTYTRLQRPAQLGWTTASTTTFSYVHTGIILIPIVLLMCLSFYCSLMIFCSFGWQCCTSVRHAVRWQEKQSGGTFLGQQAGQQLLLPVNSHQLREIWPLSFPSFSFK